MLLGREASVFARYWAGDVRGNLRRSGDSLEAFDRRDKASWLEAEHPDFEVITSKLWPEGDVRGGDAAWDFYVTDRGDVRASALQR